MAPVLHIHRLLQFVGQSRSTVFELGDFRFRIGRARPIFVAGLFLPLAIQAPQRRRVRSCFPVRCGHSLQKLQVVFARLPPHDRPHGCIGFQRGGIHAHGLALDQSGACQLFQHPAEYLLMGVGVQQSPCPGNGNVIRGGLIDSVAQKFPQAQRVGHPPGNAPLAVQPFEESDQHQPEVDARSQRWSAHPVRVITLTFSLAKLVEARLFQHPFQFPVERMPRSFGHFGAVPQPFLPLSAFPRAHRHNRFYTETSQIGNGFRHRLLASLARVDLDLFAKLSVTSPIKSVRDF